MKSFSDLRTMYNQLTNNTTSENQTFGDRAINDGLRKILSLSPNWDFLETSSTTTTVEDQQAYQLPYNVDKVNTVTVTVSDYVYPVEEVPSRDFWNELNVSTSFTSTYPEYFYIDGGNLLLYPIPSASGNTITFDYKKGVRDLSVADYDTGTVTLTNADETVTGSGTTFTAAMAGRWLKGDNDGFWYEINSFTSTTVLELRKKWQGTTAAGLSYTIGEMSPLPEAYQDLPVFYATSQYYLVKNTDKVKFAEFKLLYDEGTRDLLRDRGTKTTSMVMDDGEDDNIFNPNLYLTL